ncbi:MAG: ATP-binding cassette domain-containing protein, partial [Planctomycetia bacterium]|nr:ATP-binding cassette domain-containing protein [Planctomycetia bacterium]
NLSKSFGKRKAVDSLSFEIKEGEIFGFLGPNGAGKSTAIRSMLALIKPDSGDIEIFNKSVGKYKNSALSDVGALVERPDFYEYLSAYTNLSILATMDRVPKSRILEVLEIVGLVDRRDDKVKAFSQGMKQRLGIAQALLSNPKLLILDEPTNGLDPRGMKEVRDLIRKLTKEGITILLSSHLLHEVEQVCSTMAIINLGKLIKIGSVHDLLNESDTFVTEIKAEPLDKTRKILDELKFISFVEENNGVFKIKIANNDLSRLTRNLVNADIDVSAIIPRTSLEDYFLSLTSESI